MDRSKGGLGLGLALVKGLAELHNGTVTAHSDGLGSGSTFTVRLPLHEALPQKQAPDLSHDVEAIGTRRILLIEDNHDAAKSMARLLQHLGYEVELAFNGPEGLETARRTNPDVVICDIGLPGLDGFSIARFFAPTPPRAMFISLRKAAMDKPTTSARLLTRGLTSILLSPSIFHGSNRR